MRTVGWAALAALAALILAGYLTGAAHARQAGQVSQGQAVLSRWVAAWTASPQPAGRPLPTASGLRNQTVRDVVFPSAGGNALRLVLSNRYGTSPLRLGRVTAGLAAAGAAVKGGSIRPVTFAGGASVTVAPGAQVTSDPVTMAVPALRGLTVSAYLPGEVTAPTVHLAGRQRTWLSSAGDHAAATGGAAFRPGSLSWFFLTGVLVPAGRAAGTVVAFGDSITDGSGSTVDANARWPDDLARRLNAVAGPTLSVADEGISGDRVAGGSPRAPSGVSRFGPDALDVPGARDIIVAMGINDITQARTITSAQQVLSGYRQLIARARARGLRVLGATLLPFQGARTYSDNAEALRELVNMWIRTSGAFDAVIDFDALVRDPADPLRLRPAYSSSDHLHPNDAGYRAMASGISLQLLLNGQQGPRR